MVVDHDAVERALAEEALARRERERVAAIESEHPLRRPVLSEFGRFGVRDLGIEELLASDGLSGVPQGEMVAALAALEDECCLLGGAVEGETRWRLTAWGGVELARHRAFGRPEPPPTAPTREEIEAFLEEAFDHAIDYVAPTHGAEETAGRLRAIAREARKDNLEPLASRAEVALVGLC